MSVMAASLVTVSLSLSLLLVPARAQGAPPPSIPATNVYHLYIVDVRSVSENLTQARSYVTFRWRSLSGQQSNRQSGVVVLLNGVRAIQDERIELSLDDANQETTIALGFAKVAGWPPGNLPGLEVGQLADRIRQHIETHVRQEIRRFQTENRANGILIVVHLIGDDILYTVPQGGTVSLDKTEYADECFANGAMTDVINGFPDRLRRQLRETNGAGLRGLLVIVPSGDRRHVPAAERAAAMRLFGSALFDNSVRVIRDGLDCLEVEADVKIERRDGRACGPGNAVPPRPRFTATTCVPVADRNTAQHRDTLMNRRYAEIVLPLVQGHGILMSLSTPPVAPQQQANAVPPAPPTVAPVRPQPAPAAQATPPPPPTPPQQQTTAPTPPVSPPRPQPAPAPQATPPTPPAPSQQHVTAPSAPPAPAPEARMGAITSRTGMPAGLRSNGTVNGTLLGADRVITMHLVPHSAAVAVPIEVTRGTISRLSSGTYSLQARVAPEAQCGKDGSLSFQFILYGYQFGQNPPGEFSVTLTNACRAINREAFVATVTIP